MWLLQAAACTSDLEKPSVFERRLGFAGLPLVEITKFWEFHQKLGC